jgi:hypothetical protein
VLSVGIVFPVAAQNHSLVRFDGGIGVIPVSNGIVTNGVATRNVVRLVNPPGQIWVIKGLKSYVSTEGLIRVRGRGLLLGGGNNIGFNGGQSVFATLICEATAPFTERNTERVIGVALEPNGDFLIDDVLTPAPPADCASPVLLIRNLGGAWFAAGIPKLDDDDD